MVSGATDRVSRRTTRNATTTNAVQIKASVTTRPGSASFTALAARKDANGWSALSTTITTDQRSATGSTRRRRIATGWSSAAVTPGAVALVGRPLSWDERDL